MSFFIPWKMMLFLFPEKLLEKVIGITLDMAVQIQIFIAQEIQRLVK